MEEAHGSRMGIMAEANLTQFWKGAQLGKFQDEMADGYSLLVKQM